MPTDDERREVAARLRKHIGKPLFTGQDVEDIVGVQRSDFDVVLADASYRRLADLIEPEERTCRVVTEMRALSQTQDMHTKSCSSCGYVFGSEQHRQLLPGLGEMVAINPVRIPKFCPNCGAKVVHDA